MNFNKVVLISVLGCLTFSLAGCKWRDDFRSRLQPQYQERDVKPTFNEDSDDFVGEEYITGRSKDDPELESIDELSDIPELPERPGATHY
jgi:hypothetical protein